MNQKAVEAASYGEARNKYDYFQKVLSDYAFSKATPTIGLGRELISGEAFGGRPLPWSAEPGKAKAPKYRWDEWLAAQAPLITNEPAKYIYDRLREGGASAFDAQAIIKGLIISGLGATGMRVTAPVSAAEKAALDVRAKAETSRRRQIARQLRGR
jgi:hypothetical protein